MVDDDSELCEMVAEYLRPEGFEVSVAHDGASGVARALKGDFALLLLDVMLPRLGGFEVLRRLRAAGAPVPVLMLTARGQAADRVVGLEAGADDYLSKPFDERELIARMRAILRRSRAAAPTASARERLRAGDVELDGGARVAWRGAETLQLTAVEFDLLALLLRSAGAVVGRQQIAREVFDRKLTHSDRCIDTHISHLRRKLGPGRAGGERILTVRGVGYVYTLPVRH
jgi:two-component system response regulator CpxR